MCDEYFDVDDDCSIPCPACGAEIYDDVPMCPQCGEYIVDSGRPFWSNKPRWLFRLAVILVILAAIGFALPWLSTLFRLVGG
ncbi:MAG: zinc-ribbon domain-containing protein [Mariniblastus sp.]|nr:zinc-ribbon domain-containing protein [Mariniblastus sp.]